MTYLVASPEEHEKEGNVTYLVGKRNSGAWCTPISGVSRRWRGRFVARLTFHCQQQKKKQNMLADGSNMKIGSDIRTIQFGRREFVKGLAYFTERLDDASVGVAGVLRAPTQPCTTLTCAQDETSHNRCTRNKENITFVVIWKTVSCRHGSLDLRSAELTHGASLSSKLKTNKFKGRMHSNETHTSLSTGFCPPQRGAKDWCIMSDSGILASAKFAYSYSIFIVLQKQKPC